jgi:hypothetical protein
VTNAEIALAIVDNIKNNLDSSTPLDELTREQMLFMLETIKALVSFKQ